MDSWFHPGMPSGAMWEPAQDRLPRAIGTPRREAMWTEGHPESGGFRRRRIWIAEQ
jgi:hypothetical protein